MLCVVCVCIVHWCGLCVTELNSPPPPPPPRPTRPSMSFSNREVASVAGKSGEPAPDAAPSPKHADSNGSGDEAPSSPPAASGGPVPPPPRKPLSAAALAAAASGVAVPPSPKDGKTGTVTADSAPHGSLAHGHATGGDSKQPRKVSMKYASAVGISPFAKKIEPSKARVEDPEVRLASTISAYIEPPYNRLADPLPPAVSNDPLVTATIEGLQLPTRTIARKRVKYNALEALKGKNVEFDCDAQDKPPEGRTLLIPLRLPLRAFNC